MLQDYEIKRTPTRFEKVIPDIEFILVLIIIQSALMLFTGDTEEGDAIRFRLLAHSDAPVDQQMKEDIRREIEPMIAKAINNATNK